MIDTPIEIILVCFASINAIFAFERLRLMGMALC